MSSDRIDAESKVSGNQANIPARIRRELDIDDGDQLRWHLEDDGSIRVHVIQQQTGTFADFDGYEETTDVTSDHDGGVDVRRYDGPSTRDSTPDDRRWHGDSCP